VTLFFVFVFVSTLGVEGGVFAWVCRRRIREKSRGNERLSLLAYCIDLEIDEMNISFQTE
jgi:hypothetical protein